MSTIQKTGAAGPTAPSPVDPLDIVRRRSYVQLLVLAALLGVPMSALAYGVLSPSTRDTEGSASLPLAGRGG